MPENVCLFLHNHRAARLGVVSRLLTPQIHTGQLLAIYLLEEEGSNITAQTDRETRCKYAGPFAGIVTLACLTVSAHSPMSINFSAFRNIFATFFEEMDFFPQYFFTSLAVTETFLILSNLSL